ncbi:Protein of unknown function [Gryllus bimaculatus]|nr:Protein of unknown function [Gryllus bimaculatus]
MNKILTLMKSSGKIFTAAVDMNDTLSMDHDTSVLKGIPDEPFAPALSGLTSLQQDRHRPVASPEMAPTSRVEGLEIPWHISTEQKTDSCS